MGRFRDFTRALAIIFFLASAPASAADPLHFAGWYKVIWGKNHIGNLFVEISDDGKEYSLKVEMEALGMVRVISRYRCQAETKGNFSGAFPAATYETRYKLKGRNRHIVLTYGKGGKLKQELNEPPENRSKRPEVEAALKEKSYDPLSLVMKVRKWLAAGGAESLTLPMYDGRRRADVKLTVSETAEHYMLLAGRTSVAGFTKNELADMQEQEPDVTLRIPKDGRFLPDYARAEAPIGYAEAFLQQECKDFESCKKAAKRK